MDHAGVLSELHMDACPNVREAAATALAQVRAAVDSYSRAGGLDVLLAQQLRQHRAAAENAAAAAREARTSVGDERGAEGAGLMRVGSAAVLQAKETLGAQLKRTASGGAMLPPRSESVRPCPQQRPSLRQVLAEESAKRRWARPRCHEVAQAEANEVLSLLRKPPVGAQAVEERTCALAAELEHADAGVRASAAIALGRLGPAGTVHAGHLRPRLTDTDAFVRAAAAASLAQAVPGGGQGSGGARASDGSRTSRSACPEAARRPRSAPRSASNAASRPRPAPGAVPSVRPPRPVSAGAARRPARAVSPPASPKLARGGRLRRSRVRAKSAPTSPKRSHGGSSSCVAGAVRCNCGVVADRLQALDGGPNDGFFYFACPQERSLACGFLVWDRD